MSSECAEITNAIKRAEKFKKDYCNSIKNSVTELEEVKEEYKLQFTALNSSKIGCLTAYKADGKGNINDSTEFTKFKQLENDLKNVGKAVENFLASAKKLGIAGQDGQDGVRKRPADLAGTSGGSEVEIDGNSSKRAKGSSGIESQDN